MGAIKGREAILSKIRAGIGRQDTSNQTGDDAARRAAVANRLQRAPNGIIPERGQLDHAEQVKLFSERAIAVQTSVDWVASYENVPDAVAGYLRNHNLPAAFRTGDDTRLKNLDWGKSLNVTFGASDGSDPVGVSHAFAGVAETGTLILASGQDNPTTINFLPDSHIVVVNAADVTGDYETALERVRERYGKGKMPRTLNMITGPSRSGDIEQTILLGAHGPRSLHIIVVG